MSPLVLDGCPFTAVEAHAAGVSRRDLAGLVRFGVVRRLLHDVYVDERVTDTVELRVAAVAKVLPPGAVVARRTAAWLYGIDVYGGRQRDQTLTVECVVPARRARVRRAGVRGWEETLLPEDVCSVNGVPGTTPTRTALDLARYSPRHLGLAAVDAFCHADLTTPYALQTCAERFRGGRFIARARELVGWAEPLTESPGESWLRLRILDAGLPRPRAQIRVCTLEGVEVFRIDLGYPDIRLGLEYDGREYHGSDEARAADRERRTRLRREFDWDAYGFDVDDVFGPNPQVEVLVGKRLGVTPLLPRMW